MELEEYKIAIKILKEIANINTWTARKHKLLKQVIEIMETGRHEYFTSKPIYHCEYIGNYYTENKFHKRKGTLIKYRGYQLLIICVRRGSWNTREFLVATVN